MQMVMHAKVGWEVEHWRMGWGAVQQWPAVNDEGAKKQAAREVQEGAEQHQSLWQLGRDGAEREELSERREAERRQQPQDRRGQLWVLELGNFRSDPHFQHRKNVGRNGLFLQARVQMVTRRTPRTGL